MKQFYAQNNPVGLTKKVFFFCDVTKDSKIFLKGIMLEFYPNPSIAHQGLLQGHTESLTNNLSCNGHGRRGMLLGCFFFL